jgi:3-dehydroquinate synthase class II
VDIRGRVIASRYSEGQVILEVEALAPSVDSRYQRAYVLVTPTAQKLGPDGGPISISELHQGQNVAILLRGGGRGTLYGVGVARKLWVEEGI